MNNKDKIYWMQKITNTIFDYGCTVSKPMVESVFEVMQEFKKSEPIEQDAFVWTDELVMKFMEKESQKFIKNDRWDERLKEFKSSQPNEFNRNQSQGIGVSKHPLSFTERPSAKSVEQPNRKEIFLKKLTQEQSNLFKTCGNMIGDNEYYYPTTMILEHGNFFRTGQLLYTSSQYFEAIEKAFEAGGFGYVGVSGFNNKKRFAEYLKNLKQTNNA